ncbi:hypothetical protein KFK14_09940 [Sphingobium phenoxybenzoativorans]|jgi:hypothetical protein|uniref:Uncharacterized protein n=1 Tax=Sphingobium phenoxybenzoativorans TaxID=1592790 RepID=A0A975KA81_9SPHN|nr:MULTISPECIES: hypothetical protein [Sphingobium]QUT07673.1 hypothetical protein KFK14_09940 [Sphingobium phenoxybenzoativorans]
MTHVTPFIQNRQRLAQAPGKLWSARHSQQGCQGTRAAGAVPLAPSGTAPNPVSTVVNLPDAFPLSDAPARVMAVLTTFEHQAMFRIIKGADRDKNGVVPGGDIFRLRKGSRTHALCGVTS